MRMLVKWLPNFKESFMLAFPFPSNQSTKSKSFLLKEGMEPSIKVSILINPIILSRLLQEDERFDTFISLSKEEVLIRYPDGEISLVLQINACRDKEGSPVLKCSKKLRGIQMVAAYDAETKTVWVIPAEELEDRVSVRLGEKWEDYVIPPPSSLSFQERRKRRKDLKDRARELARDVVREMKDENISEADKEDKR